MKNKKSNQVCTLSISPSTKGFGFAVMKDAKVLADWGTRRYTNKDHKTAQLLPKVEKLIARFKPGLLVLPDVSEKGSRRSPWVRKFSKQVMALALRHRVKSRLIPQEQLRQFFFAGKKGNKHARAQIVAERFPEELADLLPPERQTWMNEHHQMQMFDAVAVALASSMPESKTLQ